MDTEFIVKVSFAKMPATCWGRYQHIAVMEVEKGTQPKMISEKAKGVIRIVKVWRNQFLGKTSNCAARLVLKEANALAIKLNKEIKK